MRLILGHTERPNRYNRNLTWLFSRTWAPKQDAKARKCVTSKSFEELNTNYSWLSSKAMILLGLTPIQIAVSLIIKDVSTYLVQCQACCTKLTLLLYTPYFKMCKFLKYTFLMKTVYIKILCNNTFYHISELATNKSVSQRVNWRGKLSATASKTW